MSLSDPIADMLTRIRNASRIGRAEVNIKASKLCAGIAQVLKDEGYIEGYDKIEDGQQGLIRVSLKYDPEGTPAIREIVRESKPGKRVYLSMEKLPHILGGMGIAIISTSKGVFSDRKCRQEKVGGEILCTVN
ncbi:MAG: 30S ribosomal protein S8 [Phycisphaerae bacterium]